MSQLREADPLQREVNRAGLELTRNLLGGQGLPGFLEGLPGGISPEVTTDIVQESLSDVAPGLQQLGLADSGVRAELETQTAADIRRRAEEFNINNLLQLLSLAQGFPAAVQQPILSTGQQLSARLAGLRPVTTTGRTTTNQFGIDLAQNAQVAALAAGCWVAAEIFGGWHHPKTNAARFFYK